MPTLLRVFGFKFFFYANDHAPAHVPILKGERWTKIEIQSLEVIQSSLKQRELTQAIELTQKHQIEFMEKWNEWFKSESSSYR